jgi:hypothetical protein
MFDLLVKQERNKPMDGKQVDLSYIDGYCAVIYYEITEAALVRAESEGNEYVAERERERLQGRPNWTYDPQGMMVSYDD